MVHKTTPEHEHAKIFAPIFIGVGIGLAILGSMPIFLGSNLPVSNANSNPVTYSECIRLPRSIILEKYPPVCITEDGKSYEKVLPRLLNPGN
jgi:hypothetical protein